jgi:hypothetical protein
MTLRWRFLSPLFAPLFVLVACGTGHSPGLTAEVITVSSAAPADPPPGECWDSDVIPAVIETETVQSLVSPEQRDAAGQIISPASYQSVSKLRMIQDRSEVWFRVPCPEMQDTAFLATLQRALKARGYFLSPVTGQMDAETAEAVRRFQATRGLESKVLSLAAAQELGLVAVPLDRLQ